MFFWGTCLFVDDAAKRDSKEHKIGFSAYQIFYQHCLDRHAWTEFRYRSKDKAKDIMPLIIRGLRNEKVTLGTDNEAPAAMVCATKKTKTATKTTRLTTTKGLRTPLWRFCICSLLKSVYAFRLRLLTHLLLWRLFHSFFPLLLAFLYLRHHRRCLRALALQSSWRNFLFVVVNLIVLLSLFSWLHKPSLLGLRWLFPRPLSHCAIL